MHATHQWAAEMRVLNFSGDTQLAALTGYGVCELGWGAMRL